MQAKYNKPPVKKYGDPITIDPSQQVSFLLDIHDKLVMPRTKRLIHHKKWDDDNAAYSEWWSLVEFRPARWFRKAKWVPVYDYYFDGKSAIRYYDKKKVVSAVKHYNLRVVEAKDND